MKLYLTEPATRRSVFTVERTGGSPPALARRAWRATVAIFAGMLAIAAFGASSAHANAGKVLVFTGTAGTANASSPDIATAITALGTANDFTVDTSSAAADINATNLANYRAVVF